MNIKLLDNNSIWKLFLSHKLSDDKVFHSNILSAVYTSVFTLVIYVCPDKYFYGR